MVDLERRRRRDKGRREGGRMERKIHKVSVYGFRVSVHVFVLR